MKKKLNPQWLNCAFVMNPDGSKFGTIVEVGNDKVTVLRAGIKHFFQADQLDARGLLSKSNATDKKYIPFSTMQRNHNVN